jgi:hypothetical protein
MPDPAAPPRRSNLLTIGVLGIALAAVFLAGLEVRDDGPAATSAASAAPDTQSVGVVTSGEGSAEGKPDQLTFSATVTNRRDTNAAALQATPSSPATTAAAPAAGWSGTPRPSGCGSWSGFSTRPARPSAA